MQRGFLLFGCVSLVACGAIVSGGGSSGSASSGTSTTSSAGSSTGDVAGGSSSGAGPGGATGACTPCGGECVDFANDPHHCGGCAGTCSADQICDHGVCSAPTCLVQGPACPLDHVCCGGACCPPWQMCCNAPGSKTPICMDRDAGICPTTCTAEGACPGCSTCN